MRSLTLEAERLEALYPFSSSFLSASLSILSRSNPVVFSSFFGVTRTDCGCISWLSTFSAAWDKGAGRLGLLTGVGGSTVGIDGV